MYNKVGLTGRPFYVAFALQIYNFFNTKIILKIILL